MRRAAYTDSLTLPYPDDGADVEEPGQSLRLHTTQQEFAGGRGCAEQTRREQTRSDEEARVPVVANRSPQLCLAPPFLEQRWNHRKV